MQIALSPDDLRPLIQQIVTEAIRALPAVTTPQPEALLVTRRQAAKMLNLSESTIDVKTKAGEIPAVRVGAAVRYRLETLREWATKAEGVEVAQ